MLNIRPSREVNCNWVVAGLTGNLWISRPLAGTQREVAWLCFGSYGIAKLLQKRFFQPSILSKLRPGASLWYPLWETNSIFEFQCRDPSAAMQQLLTEILPMAPRKIPPLSCHWGKPSFGTSCNFSRWSIEVTRKSVPTHEAGHGMNSGTGHVTTTCSESPRQWMWIVVLMHMNSVDHRLFDSWIFRLMFTHQPNSETKM